MQQDVLALETAAIALVRRLGDTPPAMWPESAVRNLIAGSKSDCFVANCAAVAVSSNHDLTPWLEDPLGFAVDATLEPSIRHWLIYVPAASAAPTYAELSERAARVLSLLFTPKTAAELSPAFEGLPVYDIVEVIDALAEIGVVGRQEEA